MLNTNEFGESSGTPLILVHGLFGSARNWQGVAKRLSDGRRVVTVDMRNHGQSHWATPHDYHAMSDDLIDVIDDLGGSADVLGHSMGGKAAMVLALRAPQRVRRLIVADIAPIGYGHTQMPMIDAIRGVDLRAVTSRRDADAQLARHLDDPGLRAFLLQSLDLYAPTPRWRLNLEVLARDMDKIMGFPDVTEIFAGEVLFVTGGESDYVRFAHHAHIRSLFPQAQFATVKDAGHWLHAENPKVFERLIRDFLQG